MKLREMFFISIQNLFLLSRRSDFRIAGIKFNSIIKCANTKQKSDFTE